MIGSHIALGEFLGRVGRNPEAAKALGQALNRISLWDSALSQTGAPSFRANAEFALGSVLAAGGQVEAAEVAYRRAIAGAQRLVEQFPDELKFRRILGAYGSEISTRARRAALSRNAATGRLG